MPTAQAQAQKKPAVETSPLCTRDNARKIDVNRGIEELGNAVRTINALESPDFSQQYVMMKIEGETFGSFASFSTPGFNPENMFREMGQDRLRRQPRSSHQLH